MPKTVKRYQGFSHAKDLRYLKIPFENDRDNYLSVLPKELFLNIFYKACTSEHEEYQHLLCKEIRRLLVCPNTGWVRLVTTALVATQPLKSIYPPSWKPVRKKNFDMIHKTPNVGRTTNCSHYHPIIDYHLSVGLSIAVYCLICPPLE